MRLHLCLLATLAALPPLVTAADSSIVYDGSSTVYPIVVAAAEGYAQVNPRFSMEAKPTGSSAGIRSLIARSSSVSGASRPISAKEVKAAADAKVEFVEIPIAFDAISLVANPRNPWLKDLTVAELQTLYATNGPTSWKQVRASFPDAKLSLYGPGSDSGTADYFHETIVTKERRFRSDITVSEDDHVLVEGVSTDINAIGYFGLAYLIENAQVIRAIAIDSGKGAVLPSKQSVLDGTYVPLSRPIFLYVSTDQLSRSELSSFITWLIDNPAIIESVGYVSLPATMRAKVKERFAKRTTGSLFGAAAAGMSLGQVMGVEASTEAATPPAAKPAPVAVAAAVAAKPPAAAWSGPSAAQYQQDLERLRAASLDLARRALDDGSTVEDIAKRTTELRLQADALAEAFRTAPRRGAQGLSLAEAAALAK